MLNYISSVIRCFTIQQGDYSSRTSCKTFWGFSLVLAGLIVLLLVIIDSSILFDNVFWGQAAFYIPFVLLIELIPTSLAALVRRFHDRSLSGYWVIPCLLIPFVGWAAGAVIAFFLPGQVEENNYPRQIDNVRPFWKLKRFWFLHAAVIFIAATQLSYFPVTITENSHYITQPRTEDGKVDYAAAMFKIFEPRFKNPEENGVRLIYQLYGSKVYWTYRMNLGAPEWTDACKQLQLDPNLKPKYEDFPRFEDYLTENKIDVNTLVYDKEEFSRHRPKYVYGTKPEYVDELKQEDDEDDVRFQERFAANVYSFYAEAMSSGPVWTSAQHPVASKWLDDRAEELDTIAKAVRMPIYQYPLPLKSPDIFRDYYPIRIYWFSRDVFNMRIRRSLGDGNVVQVLDDIETLFLFAKHYGIGINVAETHHSYYAFAQLACDAAKTALQTPGFCESLTDEQWKRLNDITSQECEVNLKTILNGEFMGKYNIIPDYFIKSSEGSVIKPSEGSVEDVNAALSAIIRLFVDENYFRQQAYLDRQLIQDAFLEKDRAIRKQKFDELRKLSPRHLLPSVVNWLTIRKRSYTAAHCFFYLAADSCRSFLYLQDMISTNQRLIQVAIAIERYRVKEGKYPESLEQLTDKYWDEKKQGAIRFDPCSGKNTLGYRINAQSKEDWERELKQGREKDTECPHEFDDKFPVWRPFILYSVGPDLKDDNGKSFFRASPGTGDVIY